MTHINDYELHAWFLFGHSRHQMSTVLTEFILTVFLPTVEGFAASDCFWCWLLFDVKSWNAEFMLKPASWETASSSDNTVRPSCFRCSQHSQTTFPLVRRHLPTRHQTHALHYSFTAPPRKAFSQLKISHSRTVVILMCKKYIKH